MRENPIGKKYGKLTVISRASNIGDRMSRWLCKCDCGKEKVARLRNLKNGECKSCGCLKLTRVGLVNGSYFDRARRGAKARNLEFSITVNDAWKQFQRQNGKCALSGEIITLQIDYRNYKEQTASLDRIDSSKGYTIDNIQWIHKDLNRMKMDMDEPLFIQWVTRIHQYRNRVTN